MFAPVATGLLLLPCRQKCYRDELGLPSGAYWSTAFVTA